MSGYQNHTSNIVSMMSWRRIPSGWSHSGFNILWLVMRDDVLRLTVPFACGAFTAPIVNKAKLVKYLCLFGTSSLLCLLQIFKMPNDEGFFWLPNRLAFVLVQLAQSSFTSHLRFCCVSVVTNEHTLPVLSIKRHYSQIAIWLTQIT